MSALVVEAMNDAAGWVALAADGVTPSADLVLQDETTVVGYGADGHSVKVSGSTAAAGHLLRRTLTAPVDLTGYSELRLSLRSNLGAGSGGAPCFLELRLGSAALPVTDPAGTWHRLLPVRAPGAWDTVHLSLDDLAPAVRGALTQLQLRCADATRAFTAYLDDLVAVRPQMLADADRALQDRLAGITVGGKPAAALVRAGGSPPAAPALDIVHFDVRYAAERVREQRLLRDFTEDGFRIVSLGEPYDLDYALTPVAANRADQAALLEAVADRLSSLDELGANGEVLPARLFWVAGRDRIGGAAGEVPVLFYRVGVRRPTVTGAPSSEVSELRLATDQQEAG